MGGTEAMNILHRMLGCKVGQGASIGPFLIEDFDLVTVGDNTIIEGFLHTEDVSVGVQTLSPITVGSRCNIGLDSLVDRSAVLEDDVVLRPRTLVTTHSVLESGSLWHGKPAEPVAGDQDIENQSQDKTLPSVAPGHRLMFNAVRTFLIFIMSPYLWTLGLSFVIWLFLEMHRSLGWWGLAALIWAPVTAVSVCMSALTILCKKLLLGKVTEGQFSLYGSFHCCKYFVDHLVTHHMLRWVYFGAMVGSPICASYYLSRQLLRLLGPKIGKASFIGAKSLWTSYDLVSIGDYNIWGGWANCVPWSCERGFLIGRSISVGDHCYVGTSGMVLSGKLADHCSVAGFSVSSTELSKGQTVIGTAVSDMNISRDRANESMDDGIVFRFETARLGAIAVVWTIVLILVGTSASLFPSDMSFANRSETATAAIISATTGGALCLGIPLLSMITLWLLKKSLIGTYSVSSWRLNDRSNLKYYLYSVMGTLFECFMKDTQDVIGGTFLEVGFFQLLGCKIGSHVYLDKPTIFEMDLVHIGKHTSLGRHVGISPHQLTLTRMELAALHIGDRCTFGRHGCIHGRDSVADDVTMSGLSMPMIGTRMTSGAWAGYPAKKVGTAYQPPRPSDPTWYVMLQCPLSILFGLYWMVVFFVDQHVLTLQWRHRCSERTKDSNKDMPKALTGVYQNLEMGMTLCFDVGEWQDMLRHLHLEAGTFMSTTDDSSWWRFASYDWDFDWYANYVGKGQVSLGNWKIPKAIVMPTLRRDGNDWILGHSWFNGDPIDELRFIRDP